MKELGKFLKEFLQNKGLLVFISTLADKLCVLINTIVVVRLISDTEYGLITLIASVFAFFAPLTGLGSYQGLLRYGSIQQEKEQKDSLSQYVLKKGLLNHLPVTILYIIISLIYAFKYDQIIPVILFFCIRFIGFYFFNYIQSNYRMRGNNTAFSLLTLTVSIFGLLSAIILTYLYGYMGYLLAMALAPWVSLFFFKSPVSTEKKAKFTFSKKEFWSYSFHASITYFLSEILFSLDFFFIGFLLDEKSIAFYKTAVIIPMNLMFLPLIFMQTDFPKLAQNYENKSYLIFYIKNYYKLFIPIGILILLSGYIVKDSLIPFIFGNDYSGNGGIFFILLCAVVGNMWMRNLYGNLLAAVGKAKWNTYTSIGAIICISVTSLLLIPDYGITGAAWGMAITFTFTGISGLFLFRNYLKTIS